MPPNPSLGNGSDTQDDDGIDDVCARFLIAIPGPSEHPLSMKAFVKSCQSTGQVSRRFDLSTAFNTIVTLFSRLGLLYQHDDSVQAVSEDAGTFLHSLGQYLIAPLSLLGDWKARGTTPDSLRHRQLIQLLEEYRVGRQGETAPASRRVEAVAAIIKGSSGKQHVYLVQGNPSWGIPWWIGGIIESDDASPERALYREIEEELGLAPPAIDSMRLFTEVSYRRMSARIHAMTDYHTRFYVVTLKERLVPAERFNSHNLLETTDRDGRTTVRLNYWLSWKELCNWPGFNEVGGELAEKLEQYGIGGLHAPHMVTPVSFDDAGLSDMTKVQNADVATMLADMERIVLSECTVVGNYLRYDHTTRNALKDWVTRIESPLLQKTNTRENFLIWAAPGSGKTFLIQQISEHLKNTLNGNVKFVECNLAQDSPDEFTRKVNSLTTETQPVLCLIDEVDARSAEEWPYEVSFPKLDLNCTTDQQVVIVLIGSTESSLGTMHEAMGRRHKGKDLLSRILYAQKSFEIPATTLEDAATMVVGQISMLLAGKVHSVEKLALFYILSNETLRGSPRQLTDFIRDAASRFQPGDDRLRFHHLFRREESEKQYMFLRANEGFLRALANIDLRISP